jgi:hypothetical protein
VRHLVVERVGPDGRVGQRRGDRGVVDESKLLHHEKLPVPPGLEEWNPDPPDVLHLDAAEPVNDVGLANHLVEPVLDRRVAVPPGLGSSGIAN